MSMRFRWHGKRRAWIAFLLLPALLYRAAIPTGFMPMVDEHGQLALVFCPGEVAVRGTQHVHGAHHDRHHDDSMGSGGSSSQLVLCPFALSAGPAPLPDVLVVPNRAARPLDVAAEIAAESFSPSIVRAQSARAPPVTLDS